MRKGPGTFTTRNHSDSTGPSPNLQTLWVTPHRVWVSGHQVSPILLTKLIHFCSLSISTLPVPQATYYSFCFSSVSPAQRLPGVCDSHTSTHAQPNTCAQMCMGRPQTHTSPRYTDEQSCPEGQGAGGLTRTHNTHSHTCAHKFVHLRPHATPLTRAHADHRHKHLCTHADT